MAATEAFRTDQSGAGCLAAFHVYGHIGDFQLTKRVTFGRAGGSSDTGIQVPLPCVSARHGEFGCAEGHWFYRDLGSTNGSRINGQTLTGVCEMMDGDILTVVPKDEEQAGPLFAGIFVRLRKGEQILWRKIPIELGMEPFRIGRSQSGLTPEDMTISDNHAVFKFAADGLSGDARETADVHPSRVSRIIRIGARLVRNSQGELFMETCQKYTVGTDMIEGIAHVVEERWVETVH